MRERSRPRLILLDLMMPIMNGWRFLEEMSADPSLASIPLTVVSAILPYRRPDAPVTMSYLPKPIDMRELMRTIERVVGPPGV
jgi:CheY-like chemotaxis protein